VGAGNLAPAGLGEAEIRASLLQRLAHTCSSSSDAAIVEELGLCRGQVRVDVALVNGHLHGFEIKSDRDSLRRLAGQRDLYCRVLDRVTLVTADRHLREAMTIIPEWWGVLLAKPSAAGPQLVRVRADRQNRDRDVQALVELLWLNEALDLLEQRGLARGMRGKPRRVVWARVSECVPGAEIARAVRARLKARSARA
jgi:hypothetical protein